MAVAESSYGAKPVALPKDLLLTIFGLLTSHERRVTVPLVCKTWHVAVLPNDSTAALWEEVDIRDTDIPFSQGACSSGASSASGLQCRFPQSEETIRSWLSQRRECVKKMTVSTSAPDGGGSVPATSMASWSRAFGLALPTLATSSKLKQLTLRGPGVHADGSTSSPTSARSFDADAASAVLRGAFSLSSLEELHVYDIPWAASLLHATTALCVTGGPPVVPSPRPVGPLLDLTNLRHLIISRCFYQADDDALDGAATAAWAALGAALQALPHLERLDMSYTHATSYIDPARGVVAAPWPALRYLRELSLAHDLSVQPPPPPPPAAAASVAASPPSVAPAGAVSGDGHSGSNTAAGFGSAAAGGNGNGDGDGGGEEGAAAAAAMTAAVALEDDTAVALQDLDLDVDADAGVLTDALADADADMAAAEEALFGPPLLTIDAAHALVEMLTWLPQCTALTSLDLRHCGMEAVPLAVAHLPALARLDLYGNPLVSMRLPGPLSALAWLRLSLDPCYHLVYDMRVAEGGDAAAADEEMWVVELPAPQLEELQVDSSSSRALGLIREAAAELPLLRRLALEDKSGEALR